MTRFKDANDSSLSSKETTDSPRHDLAIEIHKISLLDTNNSSIRSKDLGDCIYKF